MTSELSKLLVFLKSIKFSAKCRFGFSEGNEPNNEYELNLCVPACYANRIAAYFGCHEDDLPVAADTKDRGDVSFTAYGSWHGEGKGNARDLADELLFDKGDLFDLSLSLDELKDLEKRQSIRNAAIKVNKIALNNPVAREFAKGFLLLNIGGSRSDDYVISVSAGDIKSMLAAAYIRGQDDFARKF